LRTSVLVFFLAAAVAGIVGVVIGSPPLLGWLANDHENWDRLGNVGQAYGGASAVLSGLALCGVALSLILPWRQARISQLYSARHHQLDLARMALEHPSSLIVDGASMLDEPNAATMVIVNLWVANWATAWQLGAMDEASLRACGARLFEAESTRRWWREWSGTYAASPRGRRFVQILTEECALAAAAEPAQRPGDPGTRPATPRPIGAMTVGAARIGVVVAAAVAAASSRRVIGGRTRCRARG
jgi:hypothetical protein